MCCATACGAVCMCVQYVRVFATFARGAVWCACLPRVRGGACFCASMCVVCECVHACVATCLVGPPIERTAVAPVTRTIAAPVAVLYQDCSPCPVHQLSKVREVSELAAPVELDPVKTKVHGGCDVPLVVMHAIVAARTPAGRGPPGWHVLVLIAAAIVAVPAHPKANRVRVVGHRPHVRELFMVDQWVSAGVVEGSVGTCATGLVIVVESAVFESSLSTVRGTLVSICGISSTRARLI